MTQSVGVQHAQTADPSRRPTVIVAGFAGYLVTAAIAAYPDFDVLVLEDPKVMARPAVARSVERSGAASIEWSYVDAHGADVFYLSHRDLDVRVVIPGVEYAVEFAARLAERYGRLGATLGAARTLRDKSTLRAVSAAAGVANPASERVDGVDEVLDFMARHPGTVVIKPANRQGSVGTRIVHDPQQAREAWQDALDQREAPYVAYHDLPLQMLVEEFVDGDELSVEMLVRDGAPVFANVTAKMLHPGDCPVELGHVVPADIPDTLRSRLVGETVKVIGATGFATGVVHCEWIVRDGQPYLVECAGRMPGDSIVELIDHAWPMNLVEAYVRMMCGEPGIETPASASSVAAVLYPAVTPGLVVSVDGVDEARAVKGVFRCGSVVRPGDRVNELRSSWDRVVGAAAVAPTKDEALAAVTEALSHIKIVTE